MTDGNNWANDGEDDFFQDVSNKIEKNKELAINKKSNAKGFIIKLFIDINVSFEPDPSYRDNVKNIIRGLVLYQLFTQRTINIYRRGKEDRDYLGSYLMYIVQKYLHDNVRVTEWNGVLTEVFVHFKQDIHSSNLEPVINAKINISKIIPDYILWTTLSNNKKEYEKRKGESPPTY